MRSYELVPQYDSRKSFYGKAFVHVDGERRYLQSYKTLTCYVEGGELHRFSGKSLCESATTQRHIREFCKQEGIPYRGVAQWREMEVEEV